jgi:tetratricopeptide (TPR) repeat protein
VIFIVLAIWSSGLVIGFPAFAQGQPSDAYAEATSAFQQGRLEQAENILRAGVSREPNRPDLLGLLAVVLDAKREYQQAGEFYDRALRLAPRSAGLWNNLGNHYLARRDEEQARTAFVRVVALEPQHANANLQLARISLSRKEGAEALQYLDKLPPAAREAPAVQLMRARALRQVGQTEAALAIVDRLEQGDPADPRLAFSLGVFLAESGKYERAEAAFSRALEKDPSSFEILHNVGLAALRAGHFDRAQRVFETAVQQRPDDVESIFNLARVHAARGGHETALVLLTQARRLAPGRPDLLAFLARTYTEAGFFSGAAEAYGEYLKLQPEDHTARRERGFAYCRSGRMQTSLADLRLYVAQYPRDPVGHFELGVCEALGDTTRALQHLNTALVLKPDFTAARQARGWLMLRDGKWQEAAPDLKSVVEREPKNWMAMLHLGRVYLELQKPAEAAAVLQRARELAPEHSGVLMQLYKALRALGKKQEAASVLEKLKTAEPDRTAAKAHAKVFDYLGLSAGEQHERFRRNLTNAVASNPTDPEVKIQLGALLLSDGRTEDALALFREALALKPGARILKDGAAALVEHEQYALAQEFLSRVVTSDPSVENRLDLAVATFHAAGPAASLAEIEGIAPEKRNGDVYLLKAQIFDALSRFEDAVESLNTGFKLSPKRPDLYLWASLFLLKHSRDQQALELLEQAIKFVPDDADLLLTKAIVLELVKKTDEAQSLLRTILLRWPEWGRAYLIRGIIEATHRDPEQALQSIRAAIALGEKTPQAYYYLAETTRAAAPEDKEAAREAISEALRLDRNDAWFHALAGKIALEADEAANAVAHLKEAVRISPKLIEAHYSLSVAYKKLGRSEDATKELKTVRRLREENPEGDEAPTGIRQALLPVGS